MNRLVKVGFVLVLSVTYVCRSGYAQLSELGNMLAGGSEDAQTLLVPYITPAVNAFGAALAGGWYNTAEAHKPLGFDITITATAAIIPKDYQTFTIDTAALNILQLNDPSTIVSQTVAGDEIAGPQMDYSYGGYSEPAFSMPRGVNIRWVPAPMIQLGLGIYKGTDLMVRYMPNIRIKGNEFGLWGLGGKHDIKQWIPGLKNTPVFQMSVMYGYTRMHTFIDLDVTKNNIGAVGVPGEEDNKWTDQYMKMVAKSQTINLLLGANLPVVSFYGGLGLVITKTNLKIEGEYPMVAINESTLLPEVVAITDPLDMEIKNQDGGITKPRVNVGMRLKLSVITLHFDYSWANYSALSGGLGVTFR